MASEKGAPSTSKLLPTSSSENFSRHQGYQRLFIKRLLAVIVLVLSFKIFLVTGLFYLSNERPFTEVTSVHSHLSKAEREKLFLSIPSTKSALAASRSYATHPHVAGSPEDFLDAKIFLELFQREFNIAIPSAGPIFDAGTPESRNATLLLTSREGPTTPTAWIDTYYPQLDSPLNQSLQLITEDDKVIWTADLVEDGDPHDEEAHKYKDAVPTWHGYSFDGDVTGELVYVNYGTKDDYDSLVAQGSNLTGKIVVARNGAIMRGLKIKGAQELGAIGVLIYNDPRDDGIVTVSNGYSPWPGGPAQNPTSVQRGSVMFIMPYPGDPSTPGYPAYKDAKRMKPQNLPEIPSLPISWRNAERLLEEIDGAWVEDISLGTRKLTGKASENKIRLINRVKPKLAPIWNAMAAIPGHIRNEVVVIGCHRDAWVMGAADPTSGTVSIGEIVRGFGGLLKTGWKPLRTIVFASWDAEEHGLIGSTEWGEDFAYWISKHVVAYLNVDVSVAGSRWEAMASPSLAHLMREVASDIPHPTVHGKTLWDARKDNGPFMPSEDYPNSIVNNTLIDNEFLSLCEAREQRRKSSRTGILSLGSGSDFVVFLHRLGIASANEGFIPTPSDAVYHYHSIYDSQRWQEKYGDPGFHRHVAVAKHLGLLVMRLADSYVLPLNTTQYSLELEDYLDKVESLIPKAELMGISEFSDLRISIKNLQDASRKLDKEKLEAEEELKKLFERQHGKCNLHSGLRRLIAEWIKWAFAVPHQQRPDMIATDFPWEKYLNGFTDAKGSDGSSIEQIPMDAVGSPRHPHLPIRKIIKAAKRVSEVNKRLVGFEQGFLSEEGVRDREWYKHIINSPGKWLGYDPTTFPTLTEALKIDKDLSLAIQEARRLTALLDELAKQTKP